MCRIRQQHFSCFVIEEEGYEFAFALGTAAHDDAVLLDAIVQSLIQTHCEVPLSRGTLDAMAVLLDCAVC
ncbi:MAG: hypothetical protein J6X18_09705 [Bacteroidales bacterium]|nr:hypothetical protein [Bacteroidales bacterium]